MYLFSVVHMQVYLLVSIISRHSQNMQKVQQSVYIV